MSRDARLRVLLYLVFFFSGSAGLVYQIIWTRMLLLTFGTTTTSVTAVLSAFMAGLAIGSFGIGKLLTSKKLHYLKTYAALEVAIGISALMSPLAFQIVRGFYVSLHAVLPSAGILLFVKFILTFLVLLPPTIAMGATLPLMIQFVTKRLKGEVSRETGRLYAINTLGAMTGVLLTGYVLIELIGLRNSIIFACSINLLISLLVFWYSKRERADLVTQTDDSPDLTRHEYSYSKEKIIVALLVFALSGGLSMAYEVAWTRLLTPTTGTYIYAFSMILGMILGGIAVGSFLYDRILVSKVAPVALLGATEIIIGVGAVGSLFATSQLTSFPTVTTVALALLPATIAMGMTFPIVTALTPKASAAASFVGKAYAGNTVGSMIGPIVGGFILLPAFGTIRTILLLAVLNFLFGAVLCLIDTSKKARILQRMGVGIGALGVLTVLLLGSYRPDLLQERTLFALMTKFNDGNYTWTYAEDATASVLGYRSGTGGDYGLLVDGVGMSVLVDETKLMSHIPLLIHPNPTEALVIAFGMGTTFRSALTHNINVDVVELVPSVPLMFPIFFSDAREVMANPKGRIVINDGRNYVLLTNKRYDVITVDPPPPVNAAGTTVLYSKEFYEQSKKILKPGGLFTEWFFYGTRADDFQYLLKSFTDVFPFVAVFKSPRAIGIYLVGSESPISIDRELIRKKFENTKMKEDINEWGYWDATNTPSLYIGDKSILLPFIGNAPPVTDDRPRTEYFLLRHTFSQMGIARNEVLFPWLH